MDEQSLSVAVVVLNWNGRSLLERFLGNWVALTPQWADLVIVDNGSTDGSVAYIRETFPDVHCLTFEENYGFADGYNRAIAMLEHDIIVLLNSDAILQEGWLEQPIELFSADRQVVAVQPKLRAYRQPQAFEYAGAAGGYLDALGYPYCAGRIFETVEEDSNQYDRVRPLMWATGACLIVRRISYLKAGGLDKCFFAHQEEIDLCWRLRARGGIILLAPQSIVYHVGGATLESQHPKKTYLNFRNNLLMLYKNLPSLRLAVTFLVRCGLDFMALTRYLLIREPKHARAIAQAWRDALGMMPQLRRTRRENLKRATTATREILSPYAIVWHYYVCRRRKYSQLPPWA